MKIFMRVLAVFAIGIAIWDVSVGDYFGAALIVSGFGIGYLLARIRHGN